MAINLTHAQFGAQFTEFVNFATRNAATRTPSCAYDNKGHPLTVRRITAVKAAIEAKFQAEAAVAAKSCRAEGSAPTSSSPSSPLSAPS